MTNISGKTILITGASKGIGKAIALSLAALNANIGLVARSQKELQELQIEIIKLGSKAEIFIGSVADETFANAAIKTMLQKFGKIDVLINMPVFSFLHTGYYSFAKKKSSLGICGK